MNVVLTERGFPTLTHTVYPNKADETKRILQQSSVVGDYPESFANPGSSALWIGDDFHLNREEVAELMGYMATWLATGDLLGRMYHD